MYRHILIPTDGSELAERGVTHGLALAKSLGAKVSVIFVVEPFSEMTGRFQEAVATYAELRKEQATSALERAANAAKEVGISCKTTQVENGQPHQAIIAAAEDKGCHLIVMSSHGRSGLAMLLIGSVTNKVLTHAKTPVLVVSDSADRSVNAPGDGGNVRLGSIASVWLRAGHFRSSTNNGHHQTALACLKGAKSACCSHPSADGSP